MRIHARLDEERARKLRAISRETGQTVSEVLKRAIDAYHDQVTASAAGAAAVLERLGFVGCAEGPADLSSRYEQELTGIVAARQDPR